MRTWSIRRDDHGFAAAIEEDGRTVLHLCVGTVRNEENIERVVEVLNLRERKRVEEPGE